MIPTEPTDEQVQRLTDACLPAAYNADLVRQMRDAAEALLKRYIGLVESGDAGNWDPFEEDEVTNLSYAIQAYDLHNDGGDA